MTVPEMMVVFTMKPKARIIQFGGCGWWKCQRTRASAAKGILITHNAHDRRWPGEPPRHGMPVLIGKVRDVLADTDGRFLIRFSAYADVRGSFRWPGARNPLTYLPYPKVIEALSIGSWQEMPEVPFSVAQKLRQEEQKLFPIRATPPPLNEAQ
jgi:hypothetical protein